MTSRRRLRALALVACAALAAAAGCDEPALRPRSQQVRDLRLPPEPEREAIEKIHEAEVFLEARKPKLAEEPLRRALELDPTNRQAAALLGECLLDRGAVADALPLLHQALTDNPRNAALHGLLFRAVFSQGDHDAAAAAAQAWVDSDGQDADAWFALGRAQYALGRMDEAIIAFRRAETLKPARGDVRSELGLALAATGKLVQAEAKQRDAVERQPENADAWFRLGDVIFRRDPSRVRDAVQAMERAVKLQPGLALAHLYLFRCCRQADLAADDPLRARGEEAWAAVLRLHTRAQLAPVVAERGAKAETSEFVLQEQVSLHPEDPAPRLALAHLLHVERRWDEAIDAYRRSLEFGAPEADTRLRLAAAHVGAGDLPAAEKAARAAAAAAPDSGAAHRLLAWTLLLQGRDEDAKAEAAAALAASPDDLLSKKLAALARMHLGEIDEGLQDLAALGWL